MYLPKSHTTYFLFVLYLLVISNHPNAYSAEKIRRFNSAEILYPGDPNTLKETMNKLFTTASEQEAKSDDRKLIACVVPHSGWGLCGDLIAKSFSRIPQDTYDTILILAPSHYYTFRGCSVPSVQGFATPLGVVRVQFDTLERLATSPYIEIQSLQKNITSTRRAIHEREFSIEVLLPFLQYRLKKFELIPIIVGEFKDDYGKESQPVFSSVVSNIRRILTPKTLVILSSDLTSCGKTYGFTPAPPEQLLSEQEKLDQQLIQLIVNKDLAGVQKFFEETKSFVCGKNAIYLFLTLIPKHAQGEILGYSQSGRKMNQNETSIGFTAINFYISENESK